MKFTFGSWHVGYRGLTAEDIDLLRKADCDILAVQEATEDFHFKLLDDGLFDWFASPPTLRLPHILRSPGSDEKADTRGDCLVFGRKPFRLYSSGVLADLKFPQLALVVRTLAEGRPLTVCSFNIPQGVKHKGIKTQTMKLIAEWLSTQPGSVVVGIDAKTPKIDHPDPSKSEPWERDDPSLLGPTPVHQLQDAFRVFLENRPDAFDRIRSTRPDGPLAVSFCRGPGRNSEPCRYDFILISQDIAVEDVVYREIDCSKKAQLNEHALVTGRLEF